MQIYLALVWFGSGSGVRDLGFGSCRILPRSILAMRIDWAMGRENRGAASTGKVDSKDRTREEKQADKRRREPERLGDSEIKRAARDRVQIIANCPSWFVSEQLAPSFPFLPVSPSFGLPRHTELHIPFIQLADGRSSTSKRSSVRWIPRCSNEYRKRRYDQQSGCPYGHSEERHDPG